MVKRTAALLLVLGLLLCGCGKTESSETEVTVAPETTEETVPATIPQDGNPGDATCKGSYTGTDTPDTVVAKAGLAELTNDQLAVWYWAEVAQYRQENHTQKKYLHTYQVNLIETEGLHPAGSAVPDHR